jgi:hypothetical protein
VSHDADPCDLGLFTEDHEHHFSLTPMGEALRTGTPGSVRGSVLVLAGAFFTKSLDQLPYSVQTGKTGFEKAFGVPLFEWLAKHPADASGARGLADRIRIEAGDFFENIPSGGDAYLFSHIIHDWSEAECLTILGNSRRAMKPNSRLLIIEMVLPTGDTPHAGKILDMNMLAVTGGQERTEPEYRGLLEKAGFRLTQVVPTDSAVSVVEALLA